MNIFHQMNEITVTEFHVTRFCNLATCVKLGGFEWNQTWPTQTVSLY